jgi:hypothetical protein
LPKQKKPTRIYLVRHAEKITSNQRQPRSLLRTKKPLLFQEIKTKPLNAIYSITNAPKILQYPQQKREKEIKLYKRLK